ncbi:MAG: Gfo/Idh/MocA family oxidoreductase [Rhizobiales bacterium]|nr:Gfo/Idh/MocA family oxidoreductase [Hyphomicrobiales bacterium]
MARSRLRAALIGVGAWGRVLGKAASQSAKIEFVCCAGRNAERLAAFAHDMRLPARADLDAVLADKDIDAVVLALPNELHFDFAQRAARAGKHVYIEKPIANSMVDALAIAALERAHGVRIVVGHCARLLTGVRAIRQAIDAGKLGKLSQIEANFSNDRGLRLTREDWRWYSQRAPGGSLSQIGVHQFDTLRYLGGDIAAVSAAASRHSPVGAEVEDQWIVTVHFADGKLGTVISSWTSPGTFNVRATGSDALMVYDIDQTHWASPEWLHENATLYMQARGKGPADRQAVAVPPGNMYRDELEMFADSVRGGASCELSAANGCQALAAVYAALASAKRHSRAVELNEIIAAAQADNTQRG